MSGSQNEQKAIALRYSGAMTSTYKYCMYVVYVVNVAYVVNADDAEYVLYVDISSVF